MNEKNRIKQSREAYLLAVRTKQLEEARERIEGMEELMALQCSLLAMALLTACGEGEAKKEGNAIVFLKEAVKRAIKELSCITTDEGDAYRVLINRKKADEEVRNECGK